jgi:formylglycine-generating enzyme
MNPSRLSTACVLGAILATTSACSSSDSTPSGTAGSSADGGQPETSGDAQLDAPHACKSGEFKCQGDVLTVCNDAQDGFHNVATCNPGLCDEKGGQCDVCVPNKGSCTAEDTHKVCSNDGQKVIDEKCPTSTPHCVDPDGKCVQCVSASHCDPSTNDCQVANCNVEGVCGLSSVAAGTACGLAGEGGKCDGAGKCKYCQAGEKRCVGSVPGLCDADGQWVAQTTCTGAAPLCDKGTCVQCLAVGDCTASTNPCQVATCGTDQKCAMTPVAQGTACGGGGTCNGAGLCTVCTPGTKVCNGTTLLTCQANGQYDAGTACTGTTPLCDQTDPACVQCVDVSVCPPASNPCLIAVCASHSCGIANQPQGTACPAGQCNGSGQCWSCVPGNKQCKPGSTKVLQLCSVTGVWEDTQTCPYVCEVQGGASQCGGLCVPGSIQCDTANPKVPQTCSAAGQWVSSSACPFLCSGGQCTGVCNPQDKRCKPGSTNTPQLCDAVGQWQDQTTCSGGTPFCYAGACALDSPTGPSCSGLAETCGGGGTSNCCAAKAVPGGTYNRGNDSNYPATVSGFLLDSYEVTVGRFRKFVAAYSQTMTAAGAGKNQNNLADPGWVTSWNSSLPANATALSSGLLCDATRQTWTPTASGNESRPINCVTRLEAYAFCIWDGGRLATEAEWNYAAAGGNEQRQYPWGAAAPDDSYAVYCGASCAYPQNVGAKATKGDGKWGHSDLAGNLWEWVQDFEGSYPMPCTNCANLTAAIHGTFRSGSFANDASYLPTSSRFFHGPDLRFYNVGVRCARNYP